MSNSPHTGTPYRVAALAHEHMLASSVTLPMEILTGAAQSVDRRSRQPLSFECFSTQGGTIAVQSGLAIVTRPLHTLDHVDLMIIPAIWRHPNRVLRQHPDHIAAISRHIARGGLTVSVGSGTFLLAETNTMSGRSVTTHWQWFDTFADRYRDIHLERKQLITQSGQVFCVSSVNSVADLMVYLCSEIFSMRAARHIENQFSPEIRQRFSPSPVGAPRDLHADELIADAQIEIIRDLRAIPSVPRLADRLGVSARTLARRFKMATGLSISEYTLQRRLDEAQSLLRRTNLSVTEIAFAVGLADPSHFTRVFKRLLGLTPTRYRAAVREKAFSPEHKPN
ncbi:MAG: helix-turn-helix domain-containing protein [Halieaceae bacterium]